METKQRKIDWCQCSRDVLKYIKRGSSSVDTGRVCPECGGKVFQEKADDEKNLIE